MIKKVIFGLLHFLITVIAVNVIPACRGSSEGESGYQSYHPVEKYLKNGDHRFLVSQGVSQGKKVLFVISVNGCSSCLELIKNFAQANDNPNVKFIYSIEHRGLLDRSVIELFRRKPEAVILDYENTPYREGLVADSPIVYFLSDGLMLDSIQLTPRIFDETVLKIRDYLVR